VIQVTASSVVPEVADPHGASPIVRTAGTSRTKADLVSVDHDRLVHPQHHPGDHTDPQIWVSGDGATITNIEGRTFLDGLSGMWNVNLGHGRRELIDAATAQLSRLAFATAYAGSSTIPAIELAERLREVIYPSIEAFYFTSGGSDSTDVSIRTARYFWRAQGMAEKSKIIALDLSYHGSSVGAASATGVDEFSVVFGPRLPGFVHIASHHPYRFVAPPGVSPGTAAADLLEQAIVRVGPGTVAAFIAEPVQGGGGGVIVPPMDYFPRIREICDRYDVLFVSDDVITGFGRTGRWFGLENWGVEPDIVQFAKGITSGYIPLGGIGVSARIKQVLDDAPSARRWWHGNTYSGHPVACAVALANLDVIEREGLVARSEQLGRRLRGRLGSHIGDHPHVGEVRGLGLLAGIEIVADRDTKATFAPEEQVTSRLRAALMERGLVTRVLDTAICLAPPMVSTESQIDRIAEIVSESVSAVLGQSPPTT
jgi:adenosylmethionine-8-amino-7-oxononanoate aminotransferase